VRQVLHLAMASPTRI